MKHDLISVTVTEGIGGSEDAINLYYVTKPENIGHNYLYTSSDRFLNFKLLLIQAYSC